MADLRIVDAPEIPTENITGEEKLPTGGSGNYSISLDSVADYTKTKKDLADNTSVDGKVNGVRQELDAHIEDLLNPHQVTKGQIGLGNVDNTADADKPVSNSTQAAIISAVAPKADKTYVDNQLTLKANKADVYTKQESSDLVNNSISTALTPVNSSLDLAKRGIVNRYDLSLTYNSGERVVLTNGDIVKSTVDGNANNPNADMTGWVLADAALNTAKLKRELVSIWDFFTDAELAAYKAAPTTYDASTQVQAFFSAISATDFGKAYCDGNFYVKQGIVFGGNGGSKTKQIIGRLKLTYIGTENIDVLFTIQPDSGVTWTGGVQVDGAIANAINYANRKVNHGVVIGGAYNCSHFTIDYIYAWNGFKQWGVWLANNTTGANIRKIRVHRGGSSRVSGYIAGEVSNFIWLSDKSGTTSQKSVISASNIIDFTQIIGPVQAYIGGDLYWLFTTANAGELETYPILPQDVRSGEFNYIFGGGFYTSGGDASLNLIGNINASVNANGVCLGALYPPAIQSTTTETNFIGLSIGSSLGSAALGGYIGCHYVEANSFNFVENTRADVNFKILNTTVLQDTARLRHMGDYRLSDGRMAGGYKFGTSIRISGVDFEFDRNVTAGNVSVDLTGIKEFRKDVICVNRLTTEIGVTVSNPDAFTKFGTGSARVRFMPTNGLVSPTITINPPAGITINDSSTPIVVTNLVGQPEFEFELVSTTKIVMRIKADRGVSFSHTPSTLGAGLVQSTVFAVADVKLGDSVMASFNKPLLGTRIWAEVTAINEVTLYQHNPTASSVDVASGAVNFKLI